MSIFCRQQNSFSGSHRFENEWNEDENSTDFNDIGGMDGWKACGGGHLTHLNCVYVFNFHFDKIIRIIIFK